MIYLIRSYGPEKKKIVKVGYAQDLNSRMKSYRLHNPYFEILATRPGDFRLEMKMQLYFTSYGLKANVLNEWFENRPEIITTLFHKTINKINKRIWKYRQFLFSESIFKTAENTRKREIYEELRMIMGVKKELPIDRAWKIESNKRLLKNMKNNYDLYF